jgi:hypothetical protein
MVSKFKQCGLCKSFIKNHFGRTICVSPDTSCGIVKSSRKACEFFQIGKKPVDMKVENRQLVIQKTMNSIQAKLSKAS